MYQWVLWDIMAIPLWFPRFAAAAPRISRSRQSWRPTNARRLQIRQARNEGLTVESSILTGSMGRVYLPIHVSSRSTNSIGKYI